MDSSGDADAGWVPGREYQLYRSPLPSGEGNCVHLAMLDPCPDIPICAFCTKFQAAKRHLPYWEKRVSNIQMSVEALGNDSRFAKARERHVKELKQAKKIAQTIREGGFFDGRIHNQ